MQIGQGRKLAMVLLIGSNNEWPKALPLGLQYLMLGKAVSHQIVWCIVATILLLEIISASFHENGGC